MMHCKCRTSSCAHVPEQALNKPQTAQHELNQYTCKSLTQAWVLPVGHFWLPVFDLLKTYNKTQVSFEGGVTCQKLHTESEAVISDHVKVAF